MATERLRRLAARALLGGATALLLAPVAAHAQAPGPARTPQAQATQPPAAEPWWVPVALRGRTVRAVRAAAGVLAVEMGDGSQQQSDDGGRTWQRLFERHGLVPVPPAPGAWTVCGSSAGRYDGAGTCRPEHGGPDLAGATTAGHAPLAALPDGSGRVVAVDTQGVVWRRAAGGTWARALLLLNQDALHGPPRVTGIAAFTAPLSDAVYLATDGYSVLESTDGGEDWVRANPGLPDGVLAITTDDSQRAVYAATRDGLWVHHLQATPAPPVYAAQDLTWRWLATAAVCVAAAAAAVGGMMKLVR